MNNTESKREQFITQSKQIHGDKYDYSAVVYVNVHTPVTIYCPYHGAFDKRPVKHTSSREGCPVCSQNQRCLDQTRFKSFEQVVECCHEIHQYQYHYIDLIPETLLYGNIITTNTKIVATCPIHGRFTQTINKHIYQKTGCRNCFDERNKRIRTKTLQNFIKDAINVHGNRYDYSQSEYINAHTQIQIICPDHGPFLITPANHILKQQGCNICIASGPEMIIMQYLKENHIDYVYQATFDQCVSVKGNMLRFDFYLPAHQLLIEYDGIYHFQPIVHDMNHERADENFKTQQTNDCIKNEYAQHNNLTLLRIPYTETTNLLSLLKQHLHEHHDQQ